nr:nucleotide sugar dehydrogenase [Alteraurantiacibacter aquimixticola]
MSCVECFKGLFVLLQTECICVVGLGYVGLPLAYSFSRKFENVVGLDVSARRVEELKAGIDRTGELSAGELRDMRLQVTCDPKVIADCGIVVVTVPTPVDANRAPDLSILTGACQTIGEHLAKGAIVIFESTVFPGATEEICAPVIESASGMVAGTDFKLAYSPERINPGDKQHPVEKITKVVAGQDEETLEKVAALYGEIVEAGIYKAASIKVAEAAKVLENTQRDINIALMNEMSKICRMAGIRTADVLDAAATKWNFMRFTPGLVGGHCIGVDPYYLTSKAEQLGYHPEVILSGRRINDSMPRYIATEILQMLATGGYFIRRSRVGVLGATFKENVPDIRNSKVLEMIRELAGFGIRAVVHDPLADAEEVMQEYGIALQDKAELKDLDALILAVPHEVYRDEVDTFIKEHLKPGGVLVDLKSELDPVQYREKYKYWSL